MDKEDRETKRRSRKGLRRISVTVTAQTAYNLDRLAAMGQVGSTGRVIDKLVRDKMMSLKHRLEP